MLQILLMLLRSVKSVRSVISEMSSSISFKEPVGGAHQACPLDAVLCRVFFCEDVRCCADVLPGFRAAMLSDSEIPSFSAVRSASSKSWIPLARCPHAFERLS
jgi:hypothetical protein